MALRADTLPENSAMLRVFADAGMARQRTSGGVVNLTILPAVHPAAGEGDDERVG